MNETCTCHEIQRADPRRHFRECPLRAPLTPDPAIDKRTAIAAAFGGCGFEYASDPDPVSDDEIREYRQNDNVHRPSRVDGQRHGLAVHRLCDAWAVQRAEILKLREALANTQHAIDCGVWRGSSPNPDSESLPCDCGKAVLRGGS